VSPTPSATSTESRLSQTRRAFDSIAGRYDDGNPLLARMRQTVWRILEAELPAGGRLLDLGCGPGLDAVHLARRGHPVVATDWSPQMIDKARDNAAAAGLAERVSVWNVGIHQVDDLPAGPFDGIYSNFGALNCVPALEPVARACAARLRPGGKLVVCVMGRRVPWERVHNRLRGDGKRREQRYTPGAVPVGLEDHIVWTAYYMPRELFEIFSPFFSLHHYRGLGLFLPPPYLAASTLRWPTITRTLGALDDHLAGLPGLRDAGDHFVMTMIRRPDEASR
jgi:SAM-dependent methyltransferase